MASSSVRLRLAQHSGRLPPPGPTTRAPSAVAGLSVAGKREKKTIAQGQRRAEGDAEARHAEREAWETELADVGRQIEAVRRASAQDISPLLQAGDEASAEVRDRRALLQETEQTLTEVTAARMRAGQRLLDARETWQARRVLGRAGPGTSGPSVLSTVRGTAGQRAAQRGARGHRLRRPRGMKSRRPVAATENNAGTGMRVRPSQRVRGHPPCWLPNDQVRPTSGKVWTSACPTAGMTTRLHLPPTAAGMTTRLHLPLTAAGLKAALA